MPPASSKGGPTDVRVTITTLTLPTYLPAAPDKNPMFLDQRVYQGSSGKVYPLPFTDRIAESPVDRSWKAIWIENEFLRVLILPEIGGRIHAIQDKTNGYDLIYNQAVIKPALVGLAGPWVSGGIEFNWPQHHRPATFLPVAHEIEDGPAGSRTVWCGDHDPLSRLKGMHGVCLHPGKAYVELRVRVYNRTPLPQTFLWWANVATRVHEAYQSFFPPDVRYVADHARRSMSAYPLATGTYYGVDYGQRGRKGIPPAEVPTQFVPAHARSTSPRSRREPGVPDYAPNDLSFYANIPVPTSYMAMGSRGDFSGGYDHRAGAGIVHLANHHISPGKKQWTWGNHAFGYAWDRNLTDPDARGEFAPYIEIMAGVYTDNQPDFSFLQPGETKSWSQYWYPIQKIGPARHANRAAAVSLRASGNTIRLGIAVTAAIPGARVRLTGAGGLLYSLRCDLRPGAPLVRERRRPRGLAETDLRLTVSDRHGTEIISYQPTTPALGDVPPPAGEPPAPRDLASADELYLTGLHLEQYRHATRCPTAYWREALRRDAGDARCNQALGAWHFRRGEFALAETFLRRAIARLTQRNANPADGEAYYHLGLCLSARGRDDEAYDAFYKAVWNQAWQSAGYHALAELDAKKSDWITAADHLDGSLRLNTDNLRARNLLVIVLRKLGRDEGAARILAETRALDPLDAWAQHLDGRSLHCDLQTALDLAHDHARAGLYSEAVAVLDGVSASPGDLPDQSWGAAPLVSYTLGWLQAKRGDRKAARRHFAAGAKAAPDYCFPARLQEIAVLEAAIHANPRDARAPYYLGNLYYDRRRFPEAIRCWEKSARLAPGFPIVWRNLGIGYFNIARDATKARAAYDRAFRANPADARLLFERDQLWKRLGRSPSERLRALEKHPRLVCQRDDLSLEHCALLNLAGRHTEAERFLARRTFQPWEGGEGGPLGQHVRTQLALGRAALRQQDRTGAVRHFEGALAAPPNLHEARHLLANQSEVHYWLGIALAGLGRRAAARQQWRLAANFKGDFQGMSVRAFSEMTYYSALAARELGQAARARKLLRDLLAHALHLQKSEATIDYFATSLPTMLLFHDDLQYRQETTALFLQAQAWLGLGQRARAKTLGKKILQRDPSHALATDLMRE